MYNSVPYMKTGLCANVQPNSTNFKSSATLGDRSFALAAPTLWNELPTEIRHANSILTFKKLVKTFLFKKAFYQFN